MISKIVYISYTPYIPKMSEDYYFKNLDDNNIEYEFWDLSNLYFEKIFLNNNVSEIFIRRFRSFNEVKLEIKNNGSSTRVLFVLLTTYNYRVLKLYRYLTKYRCRIAIFARWMVPYPENKKLLAKINSNKIIYFLSVITAMCAKKKGYVKPYDILFCGGSEGYKTIGVSNNVDLKHSKIVKVNSSDYDKFISVENTIIYKHKYAIFLDEYLPNHPDFKILNIKTVDPYEYYSVINKFFYLIEKEYDLEVIIAAHPRAVSYHSVNPFNDRKIIFNKTCELVKDCQFVIAHMSTSISYPILFNKQIIFISTEEIEKNMFDQHSRIEYFASILNSRFYIIDYINNNIIIDPIDEISYEKYKYSYLTSFESEKNHTSEIFINTVLNL